MPPSEFDINGQNQDGEETGSQQTARVAQFLSTVAKLTSHLDLKQTRGDSLGDAACTWHKWERETILRQYTHVLNAQLRWWNYVLNPFWSFIFTRKYRLIVINPRRVRKEEWELLDHFLGRAEFVFSMSADSRAFMRSKVIDGSVSPWRAMALVRSIGCKISKSGSISSSPIGVVGLTVGKAVTTVFVIMFTLVVYGLTTELQGSCVRPCVIAGSIQLMALSIYFTMLSRSLSTGRNRDARMLAELQRSQGRPDCSSRMD